MRMFAVCVALAASCGGGHSSPDTKVDILVLCWTCTLSYNTGSSARYTVDVLGIDGARLDAVPYVLSVLVVGCGHAQRRKLSLMITVEHLFIV